MYLMKLFSWMKKGLFMGYGFQGQTMKYLQAMDLIQSKVSEHENSKLKGLKSGRTNTSRDTPKTKR